jgi:hypothetical protein
MALTTSDPLGLIPQPRMRVNISDSVVLRPWAVGRKTRRAQDSVYSFKLLRAGFEPFRAWATRRGYIDARIVYDREVRTALRWPVHGAAQNRRETV